MTDIDPHLMAFAEECTKDLVSGLGRTTTTDRASIVNRLAKAMQQACEDEYGALVEELTADA